MQHDIKNMDGTYNEEFPILHDCKQGKKGQYYGEFPIRMYISTFNSAEVKYVRKSLMNKSKPIPNYHEKPPDYMRLIKLKKDEISNHSSYIDSRKHKMIKDFLSYPWCNIPIYK
jgi:hypothetical protein